MSRQSEKILLQTPFVKNKKNDGTLFLMGERLAWMMKSKDTFTIVHKYADIKSQKISPEGKAKIQLQIVLHDGNSTTFHFVHPEGAPKCLQEREDVKTKLLQLLPMFKKKVNKELEERHSILSQNPGVLQLYKDLVITAILTAEEFWALHASKPHKGNKTNAGATSQDVGVSGSFLAEIKPQADGANGLKYNLTPDIMESIFKTYPAVRRKHLENVPNKMTEADFWTKFFQSHYFHRDRVHGHGIKDIFTECAKDDDQAIKAQLKTGVRDTVANLVEFSDNTIHENYGTGVDQSTVNASNIVQHSIIKRFNQHSIMVLKATEQHKQTDADPTKKRLREKAVYEDLDAPVKKKMAVLNLSKRERYLNGPTPVISTDLLTREDVQRSRAQLQVLLSSFETGNSLEAISREQALNSLVQLSPSGSLMKSVGQDTIADNCPEDVKIRLRELYTSLGELSRHFWGCFPPTTPQLKDKLIEMYSTLKKFQTVRLNPFENEVARAYASMSSPLTNHINQMLEAAVRKFSTWKQKSRKSIK